jgi:hypothetical protein
MEDTHRKDTSWWLIVVLVALLPLALIFLTPSGPLLAAPFFFWLALLICLWVLIGMAPSESEPGAGDTGPRMLQESEQPEAIRSVMRVDVATEESDGTRAFRGRLREAAEAAYRRLKTGSPAGFVPLLQEDESSQAAILLVPENIERKTVERPVRLWIHWLLFALTFATTTWAGAAHQGVNLLNEPGRFTVGLPYSLALLAILGVHELGHYFTAKRYGIRVTPPYFIPVPMALGTFGAFIQMRSPIENRRALFDVAVAGPLAGLVVAVPALLLGLRTSTVIPNASAAPMMMGTSAGSSILFALLAKLSLGSSLEYGHVLRLSPLAFAGWLGLLVTALNLLPIGQLDGGHMAYAMFGRRVGTVVSTVAMWSLVLLAVFVWPGLTMWAILVFFIAGTAVPPLNDLAPLSAERRWLGFATFVILGLILMPLPHSLWTSAGLHCPYL